MFEKAKDLAWKAKCKLNASSSTATAIAGSAMALVLGGPSYADDDPSGFSLGNLNNTQGLGDKDLDAIVTDASKAFLSTFMKWATIGAIVVFVLALLISIVSTDEKKIQQWRNIAKGVVIVWVIIMITVPLFNFVYSKIGGEPGVIGGGSGGTGGTGSNGGTQEIPNEAGGGDTGSGS